jgi:hypothetical protein
MLATLSRWVRSTRCSTRPDEGGSPGTGTVNNPRAAAPVGQVLVCARAGSAVRQLSGPTGSAFQRPAYALVPSRSEPARTTMRHSAASPDQTRPPLPRLHQVLDEGSAARSEFGPPGSPLATTGDLLNVAKALLTWVATQSPPHRWSDGQLPADLAPQNAPQTGRLIGSASENLLLTRVELSGLEPLTSCMPSQGSTSTRVHPCRSPSSLVLASPSTSG